MADLDNIWSSKDSNNDIPWDEWFSEVEVLCEQQEIEMPSEPDLAEYHGEGLTPLDALAKHEDR